MANETVIFNFEETEMISMNVVSTRSIRVGLRPPLFWKLLCFLEYNTWEDEPPLRLDYSSGFSLFLEESDYFL